MDEENRDLPLVRTLAGRDRTRMTLDRRTLTIALVVVGVVGALALLLLLTSLVGGGGPSPSPTRPGISTSRPGTSVDASGRTTSRPQPSGSLSATPQLSPTPATTQPSGPLDPLDSLLSHIPEDVRGSCSDAGLDIAPPVVAMVACVAGDGAISIRYASYPDQATMDAAYGANVELAQIERDSGRCFEVQGDGSATATTNRWPAERFYSVADEVVGRYLCLDLGPPTITWTDNRLSILGVASAPKANVDQLVTFWINDAGPYP